MNFDVDKFRAQFPFFDNGETVYLDNAATSQKPQVVLDAQRHHAIEHNANVHRSAYPLAVKATLAYEGARETVACFIGAAAKQIVFTRGATEALNLIASGLRDYLNTGDVILISEQEHHANIVPWQFVAQHTGAVIDAVSVVPTGELNQPALKQQLENPNVKVLAINHVSNVLGRENNLAAICTHAKKYNVLTIIDGAQAVAHMPVDVSQLSCDAYVFSGHKMYAPDGIGAVYLSDELANKLQPFQGGGEMIEHVTLTESIFKNSPYKFEAGTPNVSGAVALAEAAKFLKQYENSSAKEAGAELKYDFQGHIHGLANYLYEQLRQLPFTLLTSYSLNAFEHGIISFAPDDSSIDAYDIAQLLGEANICIRAGQHCAEPLLQALGYQSCLRVSLAPYNTMKECKQFIHSLQQAILLLGNN